MIYKSYITKSSTHELLVLFADVLDELKSKGVVRSSNNPVEGALKALSKALYV